MDTLRERLNKNNNFNPKIPTFWDLSSTFPHNVGYFGWSKPTMQKNILQYASEIWNTADLLIASGIKQSEFPRYMMPFFGLILLESRMVRSVNKILKNEFDVDAIDELSDDQLQDFKDEFLYQDVGFNEHIVLKGKTLAQIVKNDKTFQQDFDAYLEGFDSATRDVLGVGKTNDATKRLNVTGIAKELAGKKILFTTVKEWSKIDLTPFGNSDVTSLEEHIKFKWADISADTAGEQYTPKDVIQLMSDIVVERIEFPKSEFITVYDPTCGGGNLLYGIADDLDQTHGYNVKTYGQDWNDTLYALAWIESRFRKDSEIHYGNTLTDTKHYRDQQFKVIVANPPHGIPWKGYSKDIYKDETDRFQFLPSTSDGQLLFAQHILHHLHDKGIAVVVHNGSALFSGDAGSGESNIRKHFFDKDWVEAIIQLPTDEFFNTGIHTYIWLFNKNKAADRRNKIMLVDAKDLYKPLKKSFGKKRKEVDEASRLKIVETIKKFKDNDFAKVFDKDYFYFNKQAIRLTNLDENGKSIEAHLTSKTDKATGEVKRVKDIKITDLESIHFPDTVWTADDLYLEDATFEDFEKAKALLQNSDYKEENIILKGKTASYHYDNEKATIVKTEKSKTTELGNGKMLIKATLKKSKNKPSTLLIKASLEPDYEKDYEVIPYSRDEAKNNQLIDDFLAKYIFKPFVKLEGKSGVEINFNKVFYQPEPLRPIAEIQADIKLLDQRLADLEKELNL